MITLASIVAFLAAPLAFKPAEAKPRNISSGSPIDNFIVWLEGMPPEKPYEYMGAATCLFGQYGNHMGSKGWRGYTKAIDSFSGMPETDSPTGEPAMIGVRSPQTFGGALERARAYKKKHAL